MFNGEITARRAELDAEVERLAEMVEDSAEVREGLAEVYRDLVFLENTPEGSMKAVRKLTGLYGNFGEEEGVRRYFAESLVMALSYQSDARVQDRILAEVERLARADSDFGPTQGEYVKALGVCYGQMELGEAGSGREMGERFCRELSLRQFLPAAHDGAAHVERWLGVIGVAWPCR